MYQPCGPQFPLVDALGWVPPRGVEHLIADRHKRVNFVFFADIEIRIYLGEFKVVLPGFDFD
jgi:hypothetical protein